MGQLRGGSDETEENGAAYGSWAGLCWLKVVVKIQHDIVADVSH